MSFLTIPFFVRWNMECSRTRQESQSKFADHQMQDDISQDICWVNFFFSLQIMSHYGEILFIVKLLCCCHTYHNKRSLCRHFVIVKNKRK